MKEGLLILGNQLFETHHFKAFKEMPIFMAEDRSLCTHFRYHKHKIIFFLTSMRVFAHTLKESGFKLTYRQLDDHDGAESFATSLLAWVKNHKIEKLHCFEVEDHFFARELQSFARQHQLDWQEHPSPNFLCSREEFKVYLASVKRPFMKTFYENMRTHFNVLMDGQRPLGEQFSFDSENRKKIPQRIVFPGLAKVRNKNEITLNAVKKLVDHLFADHPGDSANFWAATDASEARRQLEDFINTRLENFGAYQDALDQRDPFLFHSVISPYINIGFLNPSEVIETILLAHAQKVADLASVEGFIRQVLGWREFVRGIYQNFDELEQKKNFFAHQRRLSAVWYGAGKSGLPLLDEVIAKTMRYGYAHHIERLMVLSNVMLLCRVHPQEVYRWFMEMFIDSSDWVMGPNVFGMGQFSDGGLFATKPYICGSNYWIKMGALKGEWSDTLDGLYWLFIHDNYDFFKRNPRLALTVKNLDRIAPERREEIFRLAQDFIFRATTE